MCIVVRIRTQTSTTASHNNHLICTNTQDEAKVSCSQFVHLVRDQIIAGRFQIVSRTEEKGSFKFDKNLLNFKWLNMKGLTRFQIACQILFTVCNALGWKVSGWHARQNMADFFSDYRWIQKSDIIKNDSSAWNNKQK